MKKIFHLKSWLTIDQAVERLKLEFEQEVSKLDLLQLVTDQQLHISWLRNHKLYREVRTTDNHLRKEGFDKIAEEANPKILMMHPVYDEPIITINGPYTLNLTLNQRVHEFINHLITSRNDEFDFERDHIHNKDRLGSIFGIILEIDGKLYEQVDDLGDSLMPNEYPLVNELVFKREDIDDLIKQVIRDNTTKSRDKTIPSTKSNNKIMKVIGSLSGALIDGLSGVKNKDANAVLAALDLKGIDRPVSQKKLAEYLAEAYEQD